MKPAELEHRRARVQRSISKRPAITIDVTHRPDPATRDRLIDLLVELLDERAKSGG